MLFVTGLPRSRTAWFSVYFNIPHDLTGILRRNELYAAVDEAGGLSDSGLVFTDFKTHWPDAKTVIIHRNVDDVEESLKNAGIPVPRELLDAADRDLLNMAGFHIRYEDIDEGLENITEYAGRRWDPVYAERLMNMNVTTKNLQGDILAVREWI